MNRPNWRQAPSWAKWAAVDVFSGDWHWSQSKPTREGGWTDIQERPKAPALTKSELNWREMVREAINEVYGIDNKT